MSIYKISSCLGVAAMYTFSNAVQAKELVDCHECHMKRLPKAKELPLYVKDEDFVLEYKKDSELPLRKEISKVQYQLTGVACYLRAFKKEAVHIYETGVAHSKTTYDYIISEENKIPRVLMISSGGLIGIILARRGGYFKKALYSAVGAGITFSFFYPANAKEYFSSGLEFSKQHGSNILEKYGGYDTKKLAETTNAKIDSVKNTLNVNGLSDTLTEWYEKNKEVVTEKLSNMTGTPKQKEKSTSEKTT